MHLVVVVITIFMVWHCKNLKNWKQYHATILFFPFMELVYRLIAEAHDHFLWKLTSGTVPSSVLMASIYSLIVFPGTALVFLSNYPGTFKKQAVYILKWIGAYWIAELIATLTGNIEYYNGWNQWHSLIIDCMLFPGLILHYKRPLIAYLLFITVTVLGVLLFHIPIW